jgi:hypothetical protein
VCIFPEGENPLYAGVIPQYCGTGSLEALASGKLVVGNDSSEGYLRLIKEQIPRQTPVLTNRNRI